MRRILSSDWRDIQLSDNFTLGEFIVSDSFPQLAEKITPTGEQAQNLYILCQLCLQPLRNEFGPIKITSGLVDEELNAARQGIFDSMHQYGEAADIVPLHRSPLEVYIYCSTVLKWPGEVIYYRKKGHVHVALPCLFTKADHFIKEE